MQVFSPQILNILYKMNHNFTINLTKLWLMEFGVKDVKVLRIPQTAGARRASSGGATRVPRKAWSFLCWTSVFLNTSLKYTHPARPHHPHPQLLPLLDQMFHVCPGRKQQLLHFTQDECEQQKVCLRWADCRQVLTAPPYHEGTGIPSFVPPDSVITRRRWCCSERSRWIPEASH